MRPIDYRDSRYTAYASAMVDMPAGEVWLDYPTDPDEADELIYVGHVVSRALGR